MRKVIKVQPVTNVCTNPATSPMRTVTKEQLLYSLQNDNGMDRWIGFENDKGIK
jgi:hypothetical protein